MGGEGGGNRRKLLWEGGVRRNTVRARGDMVGSEGNEGARGIRERVVGEGKVSEYVREIGRVRVGGEGGRGTGGGPVR